MRLCWVTLRYVRFFRLSWVGLGWVELDGFVLVLVRLGCVGLGWFRLGCVSLGWVRWGFVRLG